MSKLVEEFRDVARYDVDDGGMSQTYRGRYVEYIHFAELLAHIERLEANQIPEGHVVVPSEPTDEMIDAGCDAANFYRVDMMNAYDAMIQEATRGEGE